MIAEPFVQIAGLTLRRPRHVCAFFQTQDQEDKVMIPFLKEGLERGEKVFCILSSHLRSELLQTLRLAGVEVNPAEKRDQLELKRWEQTVVRNGHFDQEALFSLIQDIFSEGQKQGFALTRFVARMDWVREYDVEINKVLEFEARLNDLLQEFPDPVVCVYELSKFNSGEVLDVLRTHPVVIIGDLVAENPFFVPPAIFLEELSKRGAYGLR